MKKSVTSAIQYHQSEQKVNKYRLLVFVLGLAFAANASAVIYTYNFGEKISGNGPAATTNFAALTFDSASSKFTLQLDSNFSTLFGSSAYVDSLFVDYAGHNPFPKVTKVVSGGGVTRVTMNSGENVAKPYEFNYVFGGESNKLTSGESVSWFVAPKTEGEGRNKVKIPGFDAKSFQDGALLIHGISPSGSPFRFGEHAGAGDHPLASGLYGNRVSSVSPVPEPETYAMLLAGLGIVGFAGFRKRKNENRV